MVVQYNEVAYGCMGCGSFKERRTIPWHPPPLGVFKFNVDGASRGKPGLVGIRGVFHNCKGGGVNDVFQVCGCVRFQRSRGAIHS